MTHTDSSDNTHIMIETQALSAWLDSKLDSTVAPLLVFVGSLDSFLSAHIPGSVHIAPSELVCGIAPAAGKIADEDDLSALFSRIGLHSDSIVIAYDDEGGGWAGRLIWTLDVIGHRHYRFLNGGINAWIADGLPTASGTTNNATQTEFHAHIDRQQIATSTSIIEQLQHPDFRIWDARSAAEHSGEKALAARGGRIPGAANLDWLELMDRANALRLKPLDDIRAMLAKRGITESSSVVTHCQSHHRSGLSYLVGKLLGLDIKAYDGSWSEWGNLPNTPVESDFN